MTKPISKVLIANRGAIARRIVRACNELSTKSVVVFSAPDAGAPYLAEASEAYPLTGFTAAQTYLDQEQILNVARQSGADAVHPGYGFLAENAAFAQRVVEQGMVFVGPEPRWLDEMGDKVHARKLMASEGFPVFPGSPHITDADSALVEAERIGYPLLVKPSGGGGGMGMEVVETSAQLQQALQRSAAIAQSAFSDAGVFLERWIEQPRHIEFQIIGDGERCEHVFERECSVQRRNQKLIEESPAPGIDRALITHHAELAASICTRLGYNNVGTLETLFTDSDVGFLEMNTRIQVEHGVTEMITGMDLVALQLSLAAGNKLPDKEVESNGFAVEARVYAEDSVTMLPSTGKLTQFHMPELTGVRFESGYQAGQTVVPHYDAMLAKLIGWGSTREMAIGRLMVALKALTIKGVSTNQALLLRVLADDEFLAGRVHTGIINRITGGV